MKCIRKIPTYNPKDSIDPTIYFNYPQEQIVSIRKLRYSHWLVKDIPLKFKVYSANTWDPHPINISDINTIHSNYRILADSNRGPQIIEHELSICTQFDISTKYPETILLLKNYICKQIKDVYVKYCVSFSI